MVPFSYRLLVGPFLFQLVAAATSWSKVSSYQPACLASHASCARHHPVTFSNGVHGYVGLGEGEVGTKLNDFYKYDPSTDAWTAIANYPHSLSYAYGVSSFGVRSYDTDYLPEYAYIGFGRTRFEFLTEFYRFSFADGTFTQLANFNTVGLGRDHPALLITVDEITGKDSKVLVGCGSANSRGNLNDWYSYDIASDTWEELAALPGAKRHHPFFFSVDGKAFVGLGHGSSVFKDFYRWYEGAWTQVKDMPLGKVAGTQFSYGGFGYVLSGDGQNHGHLPTGELWRYDPDSDSWTNLEDQAHPGVSRWAPGCFVLSGGGAVDVYFTSGKNRPEKELKDDVWKLKFATSPTANPTTSPTASPTTSPTASPTTSPTASPTTSPSLSPTASRSDVENVSQAFHASIPPSALCIAIALVLSM